MSLLGAVSAQGGQWDGWIGGGYLSQPLAAAAMGSLGYNALLWGTPGKGSIGYGFTRISLFARSSYFVSAGAARLELYPVSFLGLSAGAALSTRHTDLDTLDCSIVQCRGELTRLFAEAKLIFGAGPIFFVPYAKAERLTSRDSGRPFGDEESNLAGMFHADSLLTYGGVLGVTLAHTWRVGVTGSHQKMTDSGADNDFLAGFLSWTLQSLTIRGGAGVYRSSTADAGPTAFISVKWLISPSLSLEDQ
jgi:hypothetical protein